MKILQLSFPTWAIVDLYINQMLLPRSISTLWDISKEMGGCLSTRKLRQLVSVHFALLVAGSSITNFAIQGSELEKIGNLGLIELCVNILHAYAGNPFTFVI